jgi:hypothetical protein
MCGLTLFWDNLISKQSPHKMDPKSIEEARKAMIAKRFGGNVSGASTGGEGTARRKKKGSAKSGGGNSRNNVYDYCLNLYSLP